VAPEVLAYSGQAAFLFLRGIRMAEYILLSAIFDNPAKLLGKVEREGVALTEALSDCNESAVHDLLFNFSIGAYHLIDWVKAFRPDLDQGQASKVYALLNGSEALGACRDLANASKHIVLDRYKEGHGPKIQEIRRSATAATSTPNTLPLQPQWRLKIKLPSRTIAVEDWVQEVIEEWRKFFDDNRIN
jgi:hypothetical protein